MPCLCVIRRLEYKDETFSTSRPYPLNDIGRNLAESMYSTSSSKLFYANRKTRMATHVSLVETFSTSPLCMSRLISFVLADSSCEPRDESDNYKKKILAHSGTRAHYISLTISWFRIALKMGLYDLNNLQIH